MLNRHTASPILPAMKRAVLAAAVVLIALPLAAQTAPLSNTMSQFGILFGGSKRMNDLPGTQGRSEYSHRRFCCGYPTASMGETWKQRNRLWHRPRRWER